VNRIQKKFTELKRKRKKALILFLTAGDPSFQKNVALVRAFEKDGADLIELGVPFSDPLADGPVIQASSLSSLKRGTTLKKILGLVEQIRRTSQIPILLMSYLNPVLHYGVERFGRDASSAGVDGLILPDVPPEEGHDISSVMRRYGIDLVYLLAPTSSKKRQKLVTGSSKGFVYFVSLTGVTGSGRSDTGSIQNELRSARQMTKLPVCVGFGISTPEDAKKMAAISDGVIIGSALVKALSRHPNLASEAFSRRFVRPFANALGRRKPLLSTRPSGQRKAPYRPEGK